MSDDFNYKQKAWCQSVTEEEYHRIFPGTDSFQKETKVVLSCEGCFFSWKSKDVFPCLACTRVIPAMQYPYDGVREDLYCTVYKEDLQNPKHFK